MIQHADSFIDPILCCRRANQVETDDAINPSQHGVRQRPFDVAEKNHAPNAAAGVVLDFGDVSFVGVTKSRALLNIRTP
jgi:hypothetical protein